MEFTFGIITDGSCPQRIATIIDSIRNESIADYEVIVVGGDALVADDVIHVPFDENSRIPWWITRKKNLITQNTRFDRIVFMHDYIALEPGWYNGFLRFGDDWKVCMTRMLRPGGQRYRDWTLDPLAISIPDRGFLLPYDVLDLSYYMYISGAYWVAKKHVMQEFQLDETLDQPVGLRSEDMIWSRSVNLRYAFSMNVHSAVHLLKDKSPIFDYATLETINYLRADKPVRNKLGDHL